MLHKDITEKIIKAFYTVYNTLGHGFLEKVYENALAIELRKLGMFVEQQKRIEVFYGSEKIGEYFADLCINGIIILELKTAEGIAPEHEPQLLHYLKATNIELGLILNFGPKPEFMRRILTNDKKGINHRI
ncbi:MAG: GxxExxY protein [Ignavibacteriales bacterium]|nr:GxxExxY protein [Ignavibacteriales bacterium]